MKEFGRTRNKKRTVKDGWQRRDVDEEMGLATEKAEAKRVWDGVFGLGQH